MNDPEKLRRVREHLQLYEHPLLEFSAEDARGDDGAIEIRIDLKKDLRGREGERDPVPSYRFSVHPRDLDHPQFDWNLQRQLYDALHDYFIEMFTRTPQDRALGETIPGNDD